VSDFDPWMGGEEQYEEEDPFLQLLGLLDRGGMRGGRNQKEGVYSYQDQTQVPYDRYNAVNRALNLTDVPLSAHTSSGYEDVAPYYEEPDFDASAIYSGRADPTGRAIADALDGINSGEDPKAVMANVQAGINSGYYGGDDGGEVNGEEFSNAIGGFLRGKAEKGAQRSKWESTHGLAAGSAQRSLAGEQFRREVPVAEGLPPGPLGYDEVSIDQIAEALRGDKDYGSVQNYKRGENPAPKYGAPKPTAKPEPRGYGVGAGRGGGGGTVTRAAEAMQARAPRGMGPRRPHEVVSKDSRGRQQRSVAAGKIDMNAIVQQQLKKYLSRGGTPQSQQVPTRAQSAVDQRNALLRRMLGG
jgi:hypothetical protein